MAIAPLTKLKIRSRTQLVFGVFFAIGFLHSFGKGYIHTREGFWIGIAGDLLIGLLSLGCFVSYRRTRKEIAARDSN